MKHISNSEKETFDFAKQYAKKLKGGEIIGLTGDLGAGKTVFAKGMANGLGVKKTVTSPTFVLMKIYPTKPINKIKNFVHIDAYRIECEKNFSAIGADEYFARDDTITIIEWADKIKKILPKKTKFISINIKNKNKRIIEY